MLLTIEEVSERLKCSDDQVRVLIRAGELPTVNIGSGTRRRYIRIPAEELESFITRRTSKAKTRTARKPAAPTPTREWV